MAEKKPNEKPPVSKPKIRPRDVDKPRKADGEVGEESEAAVPEKIGPLPRRSDPEWLAKLAPAEPARRHRRRREGWEYEVGGKPEIDEEGSPGSSQGSESQASTPTPSEDQGSGASEKVSIHEPESGSAGGEVENKDAADSEDDWEAAEAAVEVRKRRVKRKKKDAAPAVFKRQVLRALGWTLRLLPYLAGGGLLLALGHSCGQKRGLAEGLEAAARKQALLEESKVRVLSPAAAARLDHALQEVREGDATKAAEEMRALIEEFPDVPSLRYLAALASAQAGLGEEAEKFALASIARGEKVSDSKVLLAAVEAQKGALPEYEKMGDPRLRSKRLLEEAIAADPANSGPRMELGSLLRYLGDRDGAIREIRAAKMRMHPVDSQLAADVTVALIEVEELPAATLEPYEPQSDDVRALFPAAYIALRAGNFDLGIKLLERCKASLPPDQFLYLINDPAFRKFAYREEIKRLSGDLP